MQLGFSSYFVLFSRPKFVFAVVSALLLSRLILLGEYCLPGPQLSWGAESSLDEPGNRHAMLPISQYCQPELMLYRVLGSKRGSVIEIKAQDFCNSIP